MSSIDQLNQHIAELEKEVEEIVANYEERIKFLEDHDKSGNVNALVTSIQYADLIARQTGVDKRDAPNIYPYKSCCNCGERMSCGSYQDDDWFCEYCYESEEEESEEEESEEEESEEEEDKD